VAVRGSVPTSIPSRGSYHWAPLLSNTCSIFDELAWLAEMSCAQRDEQAAVARPYVIVVGDRRIAPVPISEETLRCV